MIFFEVSYKDREHVKHSWVVDKSRIKNYPEEMYNHVPLSDGNIKVSKKEIFLVPASKIDKYDKRIYNIKIAKEKEEKIPFAIINVDGVETPIYHLSELENYFINTNGTFSRHTKKSRFESEWNKLELKGERLLTLKYRKQRKDYISYEED